MAIQGVTSKAGSSTPTKITTPAVTAGSQQLSGNSPYVTTPQKAQPVTTTRITQQAVDYGSYQTSYNQPVSSYVSQAVSRPASVPIVSTSIPKASVVAAAQQIPTSTPAVKAGSSVVNPDDIAKNIKGVRSSTGIDTSANTVTINNTDGSTTTIKRISDTKYQYEVKDNNGKIITSVVRDMPTGSVASIPSLAPVSKSTTTQPSASVVAPAASSPSGKYDMEVLSKLTKAKTPSVSAPVAKVSIVGGTIPAGSPDWQQSNAGGQASVVTQADYASFFGAVKFGKWLAQKGAVAVAKVVGSGGQPTYKDDLKARLEAGEISSDEYYDLVDEYVKVEQASSSRSVPQILADLSQDVAGFVQSGGAPTFAALSDAISSYATDNTQSQGTQRLVVQSIPSLGDIKNTITESETYKEYVAPQLEKVSNAYDYVASLGDEEPISSAGISGTPSPVTTPVAPPSRDIDTSVLPSSTPAPEESTELTKAVFSVYSAVSTLEDIEGGKTYPVTDQEKAQAALDYLNKKYPQNAGDGGDNELICKYFWYLVPQMSQNGVDYQDVASIASDYEGIINNEYSSLSKYSSKVGSTSPLGGGITTFQQMSQSEQQEVIREFNEEMIDKNIPPIVIAMFNAGVAEGAGSDSKSADLRNWMQSGGLNDALKGDTIWYYSSGAGDWLSSPQGMAAVGVGFNLLGAAGAFMVAGPAGSIAAMTTMPFSATELMQSYGPQAFKTKGDLQLSGEYAQDHVSSYNSLYSTGNSAVSNIGISKSLNDPTVNLNNIASGEQAIKDLELSLKNNWQYFEAANVYDEKVRQIEILKKSFETNKAMFDSAGNYIAKDNPPININVINTNPDWKITYGSLYGRGDGSVALGQIKTNFIGDVVITDSNGVEIGRQQIKADLYGGDKEIDAASIVAQTQKYKKTGSSVKSTKYTITVPSGVTMKIGTQTFVGGKTYDLNIKEGEQWKASFSQPGMKTQERSFYAVDTPYITYAPTMIVDPYVKPITYPQGQIDLKTSPGTKVFINGKEFTPSGNKTIVPVVPGYYDVQIIKNGKETWQKNVYVGDGSTIAISDPAQDVEEPRTYQSYSGGSGSSGGYSGGSSSSEAEITWGLIKYGNSCKDASIWQDDLQVYPEIDKEYSIDPGYHGIIMKKTGKKDWVKTVYVSKGDVLAVNPGWEDLDSAGDAVKDTDITYSKVTIIKYGNTVTGAQVWQDDIEVAPEIEKQYAIEPGYHSIRIKKPGFKEWLKTVYIAAGDIVVVSPAFEAETSDSTITDGGTVTDLSGVTTRRIYINTSPSGAKVLINGGSIGEWTPCNVDLPKGYYVITIQKTGYLSKDYSIYVGSVILQGDAAIIQARSEGLI